MSDMKYSFFTPDSKGLKQWFMHWESDIRPAIDNMLACLDGARGLPCGMSYTETVPRLEDDELTGERCMVVEYKFHSWGEDCDDAVSIPLRLFNESLFATDHTDMNKIREMYEDWVNAKDELRKEKNRITAAKRKAAAKAAATKRKREKEAKEREQLAKLIKKYGVPGENKNPRDFKE